MNVTIFDTAFGAIAARTMSFDHGDTVFYSLGAGTDISGTILVKPSRLGMHPRYGVMLTLGGYDGNIQVGDWAVGGSLICGGDDMMPGPMPNTQYPLGQIRKDDNATADDLADLLTAIAQHYTDNYTGTGLR
jgi:hypothetical protein